MQSVNLRIKQTFETAIVSVIQRFNRGIHLVMLDINGYRGRAAV